MIHNDEARSWDGTLLHHMKYGLTRLTMKPRLRTRPERSAEMRLIAFTAID